MPTTAKEYEDLPYCPRRPWEPDQDRNIRLREFQPALKGHSCACHTVLLDDREDSIPPDDWTIAAEENIDPHYPRKVRFVNFEVTTTFELCCEVVM